MHGTPPALGAPSRWIVGPAADLILIVGTPVLCVGLVLPLAHAFGSHSVWAVVMAFGAVGHHLPGFLRAYGDPGLFRRYRARFLVAPPLVFALTFVLTRHDLHTMATISLVWGIWHGMMQHYGFMRIYDAKAGSLSRGQAHWDRGITVCWFATCLVWSPNQAGSVLDALFTSGVPLVPAATAFRSLGNGVALLTVVVTLVYVARTWRERRRTSALKLALLLSTVALVYFARVVTHDPFLSVVLFEVLHDVQYLTIVWAFNHKLLRKGSLPGAWTKRLFGARASSIALYVGVCLAYGAWAYGNEQWLPETILKQVAIAVLLTSGILHFYYDGFIWKVHQTATRIGLDLDSVSGSEGPPRRRWVELAHVAAFVIPVGALAAGEMFARPDPLGAAAAMVELVPENPTARRNLGMALLERGRAQEAAEHLGAAVRFGSDDATLFAGLGHARLRSGDAEGARLAYADAIARDPRDFTSRFNLALLLAGAGLLEEAAEQLRAVIAIRPDLIDAHVNLGAILIKLGRDTEARQRLEHVLAIDPSNRQARHNLEVLRGLGP